LLLDATGTERSRWIGALDAHEVAFFVTSGKGGSGTVAAATRAALGEQHEEVLRITDGTYTEMTRGIWERLVLATLAVDARLALKQQEARRAPSAVALANLLIDAMAEAPNDVRVHADDVSTAFETLSEDNTQGRFVVKHWSAFLDAQAAASTTSQARAAFDPHRVLAYVYAKTTDKAVPMLQQSAAEFPKDFNPHARLARVYRLLGRLDEAKTSIERARTLVTGPRTLRVLDEQAMIAEARGETEAARAAYRAIVDYAAWLPPSAARAKESAKRKLDALAGVPDAAAELAAFSSCKQQWQAGVFCGPKGELNCDPAPQTLAGKHYVRCYGSNLSGDLPVSGCRMQRE
jgi:tetratricopeptide (TPR) repeat protein